MLSLFWGGSQISTWTRQYHIFDSVETLTGVSAAVSGQKVTLHKVRGLPPFRTFVANGRGPVFVCVAALAILDKLDEVDEQTLGWWLAERQLPNGGLNGRPEKLEDVRMSNHFGTIPFLIFVSKGLLQLLGVIFAVDFKQNTVD